jgi:hypothetical protein
MQLFEKSNDLLTFLKHSPNKFLTIGAILCSYEEYEKL